MAQFDPTTVAEAHRRPASFEQQLRTSTWNSSGSRGRLSEPSPLPSGNPRDGSVPAKAESKANFKDDEKNACCSAS